MINVTHLQAQQPQPHRLQPERYAKYLQQQTHKQKKLAAVSGSEHHLRHPVRTLSSVNVLFGFPRIPLLRLSRSRLRVISHVVRSTATNSSYSSCLGGRGGELERKMAFLLDPDLAAQPDPERYVSMSVTRNAHAVVPDAKPRSTLRGVAADGGPVVRPMMVVDDIPGARPRSLPPHQRSTFHDTADISGAAPRALHNLRKSYGGANATEQDDVSPGASRSFSVCELLPC